MNAPIPALNDRALLGNAIYVDGEWLRPAGPNIDVTNPATGELLGRVPKAGRDETVAAIAAARKALPAWAGRTTKERAAVLRRWHDLIVANADDLARILTAEQGKPLTEARAEILYGAAFFEWFAEEAKRVYGELIPAPANDRRLMVMRQPIGVCAAITPWNFPMAMIPRKAAPALAELGHRAGLPGGVFNVVAGDSRAVGNELVTNPGVRKVTFTGSTEVGRELMAKAAGTIKKVSLELGGNAPVLVFDDADIPTAVAGAMATKFRNMGQTCVCANRIYVQDGIYDAFVEAFCAAVRRLRVGDGSETGVEQGPLIDEAAVQKTIEHIEDAVKLGGKVLVGGERHPLGRTFFHPTVIANANSNMRVAHEETFGPLAPIFRFATEQQAIEHANDTEYGLAAYFFTRDNGRIWRVSEALEFGVIGVNTGNTSYEGAPFGGLKASGIGREGSHLGIDEFLETKYVCVAGVAH